MGFVEITKEYYDILSKVFANIEIYQESNTNTLLGEISIEKIFIVTDDYYIERDAWIDLQKNIYIKQHLINAYKFDDNKPLLYGAIAHELVHAYQYKNIFTLIFVKIFRKYSESQAKDYSAKAERWIVENREL